MKIKHIQKLVEKKEKEITKLLVAYCDARIDARIAETKEIKNGYYSLKKKELLKQK